MVACTASWSDIGQATILAVESVSRCFEVYILSMRVFMLLSAFDHMYCFVPGCLFLHKSTVFSLSVHLFSVAAPFVPRVGFPPFLSMGMSSIQLKSPAMMVYCVDVAILFAASKKVSRL